ncbi:MAG: N(G),N(G)-dimethylarginine dimethylaminohydrolase [Gammaproteobacteria bacterium]|nr:N(G),N(G)-dimethylarginine dimethylaminohydrolase [Gammaproteobacteria bacterium]NNC98151.1 N(G),N(G)-dimethylarginine dimethylaminohydrolase [Gammaproteobacteria bacterium]NNM13682.1 N(G),N(G)-dimethylarginine dimethylaminohydrolase [Gammaproteobacteria bacterium]
MFTKAIVRTPARSMIDGITSASLGKPNHSLALEQHAQYIIALESCGLDVIILPALEDFPDSCFVEDVALLSDDCAILTRPGAYSRRDEGKHILATLEEFYPEVEKISSPGTVDAGDIMMVNDHFYIGLSERTNQFGARQMQSILGKHGLTASTVNLKNVLHLKTGVAYLENNNLLACGEFLQKPEFQDFNIIEVPESESYAANSIWINDTVIMPAGFPETRKLIVGAGYEVLELDASEFQKLDGGLSCLSLRF